MKYAKIFLATLLLCSCTGLQFAKDSEPYHPPSPRCKPVQLALVLGGGGSKGTAHIGVLEELLAEGIHPDLIIGCSAGAIIGALYADTLDMERVKHIVLNSKYHDLVDISIGNLPLSLASGAAMQFYLERHLQARTFKQLKIPFAAVATNLQFGDLTVFAHGALIPAVRASAAYPGVYQPVLIEGQYFVDGGLATPVPVAAAMVYNPKVIIAVDLRENLSKESPSTALGLFKRSLEIAYHHHSENAVKDADVHIQFSFENVGSFSEQFNEFLYQEGRRVTKSKIAQIKKLLAR